MLRPIKAFFTRQCSSFTYLNVTQFLGALNDNIFKMLIAFFLIDLLGWEKSKTIMATAGLIFVVPFLLFSPTSGTLADRWSKRNIIVSAKFLEVVIMALGIWAFQMESPTGAYIILFLMATQSAYFGPSKYGIVPELVTSDKISRANGLLSLFTYLAIIAGSFLASFVTDMTNRNFVVAAVICTAIALAGFFTSFYISYTPPAGSKSKINPLVPFEVYKSLKLAMTRYCLLTAVLGSAYMLFTGAFFQLNIVPFGNQCLGLTDVQGGYLFVLTALGIGIGSVLAGKLSGRYVELGLTPFAGVGIIICYLLMDYYSESLPAVIGLTLFAGVVGGIYVIPLDTFIQVASPNSHRGQIVATANVMGFLGVLFASAVLYVIDFLDIGADKGFTFVAILTIFVLIALTISIIDYFIRFLAMIASRVLFSIELDGHEKVPLNTPSVLISNYSSWYDTLLIMGCQRRPIRLYVEGDHPFPVKERLARLLRILPEPVARPVDSNTHFLEDAKIYLNQGISVCLFIEPGHEDPVRLAKLQRSLESLLGEQDSSVIQVNIQKSPKAQLSWLSRVFHKLREPATVRFSHTHELRS